MTKDFFDIYNKTVNVKNTEIVGDIFYVGFPVKLVPIICIDVTYFTYWDWRRVFWVSWEALDLGGGELESWAVAAEALWMMNADSCGYSICVSFELDHLSLPDCQYMQSLCLPHREKKD
jgi:hypothetical protein